MGQRGPRRLAGAGLWRRGGRLIPPSGPGDIISDYSDGTTSRSSESAFADPRSGWAFQGASEAANWLGTDVPVIYADGAIAIERERTNLVTYSADYTNAAWVKGNSPDATLSATAAPDGGSAYDLTDNQAGAYEFVEITATLAGTGDHCVSAYFLKDAVTSRFPGLRVAAGTATLAAAAAHEVHLNTSSGATAASAGAPGSVAVTDEGDWWRLSFVVNATVAGTVLVDVLPARATTIGTSSVGATGTVTSWGVQLEAGDFPTSPIRTAGATGTRAVVTNQHTITAAQDALLRGSYFYLSFWPDWDSSDANEQTNPRVFVVSNGAGNLIDLYRSGTTGTSLRLAASAGDAVTATMPAFSRYDEMQVEMLVNPGGNWEMRVRNVTTGSGWTAGTPVTTRACGDLTGGTWHTGHYLAGTAYALNGVVGLPIAGVAP